MNLNVSVVHLVWVPYGIELFKEFVKSYNAHPAEYNHELIILFNGVKNEDETIDYHNYVQQNSDIKYQSFYYTKGQDLEAYFWIAGQLTSEYVFFLNSYSRFLASGWLKKIIDASGNKSIGLIGATGSWQSMYSSIFTTNSWWWTKKLTLKENLNKYILLLKASILWHRYYKPFPNPHVRTNAFFINRQLFLTTKFGFPKTKYQAYRIESGRKSITQQIIKKKLEVVLIDKYGKIFSTNEWNVAKIFWIDNQENLLISDNQTESYINSDAQTRKLLEKLAWGK